MEQPDLWWRRVRYFAAGPYVKSLLAAGFADDVAVHATGVLLHRAGSPSSPEIGFLVKSDVIVKVSVRLGVYRIPFAEDAEQLMGPSKYYTVTTFGQVPVAVRLRGSTCGPLKLYTVVLGAPRNRAHQELGPPGGPKHWKVTSAQFETTAF